MYMYIVWRSVCGHQKSKTDTVDLRTYTRT